MLKPIILKIYHLKLKSEIKEKKKEKIEKNNVQYYRLKFKKTLPYLLLIIIGTLTIANNIFAKLPEPEEFGKDSVLAKVITPKTNEFFNNDEIVEEKGPAVIAKKNTEEEQVSITAPLPQALINIDDSEKINNINTTNQETALVATTISEEAAKEGPRDKIIEYVVETGDTISGIAQKFDISVATILWSNNLTYYSVIKPGKTLKILPTTGLLHTVTKGETISSIAKKYESEIDKILEANKLTSADQVAIGNNLIIPDGVKPAAKVVTKQPTTSIFSTPKASTNTSNTKLLWPTSAKRITQYYWWKHPGLDIGAPTGTPIYAAESGTVEVAGWSTGGYGNYIIINHGNGIKTLYAHSSKLYVTKGEKVSRGQTIMAMGSTGWSTGPHLHFEVRVNGYKQNPLSYIK